MDLPEKDTKINLDRIFKIFLILHLVVWSVLPLVRQILPIDALECIYWGGLADFGTNKHPPLAGWIAYLVYNIFGKSDYSIYLLGQISIITGFIYLYKLGNLFLDKTASLLSVMIMEACFVYTYMGIYDGFNPNFLLLTFLPVITYYFYKSVYDESTWNWVKLGIFTGLSFLAKYQTIMLFIPLFLFLLITADGRKQFGKRGLYIAALIAFLIFLPHIIWLFKNEFFSFNYFVISEARYATFYHGPLKYIWSPFMFLFNQFTAISGTIFIYFTAFWFSKEKLFQDNKKNDDIKFLILSGVVPPILQASAGLNGNYMIPQWGYSLLFMCGILLFYFFPFKLSDKVIKYILFWVFAAMFITFTVLSIVFTTERNFANRFCVREVTKTLEEIYNKETGKQMKYIGGFIELTIPLSHYNNGKYIAVLDTYKHPNIWIDNDDLKKSGVIIIGRDHMLMDKYILATVPNIADKPKIKIFKFVIKNVFGIEREYTMYYAIVDSNAKYK